jgi:hypothetical protein
MKANPEIVVNVNMSLRDYFAAKAMQGLVSAHTQEGIWTGCGDETSNRIMSETAYAIAEAMLAAREAGK